MPLAEFAPHVPGAAVVQERWGPQLDRARILRISREFHRRAGTLTEAVADEHRRYRAGAAVIRTAHQPNYLASSNIVGQAVMADRLRRLCGSADRLPAVHMFTLIDYDINTDRRYRHALLPSPTSRDGSIALSLPAMRHVHDVFMFTETETTAVDLVGRLDLRLDHDHAALRKAHPNLALSRDLLHQRLDRIAGHLAFAAGQARSRSEYTAIVLSRLMNLDLGYSTMFVPGHRAIRLMGAHFAAIWSEWPDIVKVADTVDASPEWSGHAFHGGTAAGQLLAPFWLRCLCGRRLRLVWRDRPAGAARAECAECRLEHTVDPTRVAELGTANRLIPRVLADDLLDFTAWGHWAGCDYSGGLEHYQFSSLLAQRLGLAPLPIHLSDDLLYQPETDLMPSGFVAAAAALEREYPHAARAGRLASSGRASIAHALLWADKEPMKPGGPTSEHPGRERGDRLAVVAAQ
ncbi:hypothetical protein [Dactylosporangium sucinum]|nr:hypothetical protein [Dactylosporangium sucinum]